MKKFSLSISSFCKTGSGTTPSRSKYDRYFGGGIPWVKSGELRESIISNSEETITEEALAETSLKIAPKGAILGCVWLSENKNQSDCPRLTAPTENQGW
jgi:hypothetical protein